MVGALVDSEIVTGLLVAAALLAVFVASRWVVIEDVFSAVVGGVEGGDVLSATIHIVITIEADSNGSVISPGRVAAHGAVSHWLTFPGAIVPPVVPGCVPVSTVLSEGVILVHLAEQNIAPAVVANSILAIIGVVFTCASLSDVVVVADPVIFVPVLAVFDGTVPHVLGAGMDVRGAFVPDDFEVAIIVVVEAATLVVAVELGLTGVVPHIVGELLADMVFRGAVTVDH